MLVCSLSPSLFHPLVPPVIPPISFLFSTTLHYLHNYCHQCCIISFSAEPHTGSISFPVQLVFPGVIGCLVFFVALVSSVSIIMQPQALLELQKVCVFDVLMCLSILRCLGPCYFFLFLIMLCLISL